MVGIALGGLGVVSLRLPFTLWPSSAHVLDLPSVVLTICLVAFFTLIAYLTNPNEASFRAFLTELVFRQHLSRLSEAHNSIETDDLDDESPSRHSTSDDEPHHIRKLSNRRLDATSSSSDTSVPIVFHFANKASVSLKTPSYDFRSFLIVAFAVVPPVEMAMIPPIPPSSHTHHHSPSTSPKLISWNNPLTRGSCFIGAFGRWWLAFEMNMQPRQVKLAAQNDASISSRLRPGNDDTADTMDSSLSGSSLRHEDPYSGKTAAKLQHQPGAAIPRRSSGSSRTNSKSILRERSSIQSLPKRDPVFPTNPPPRPTTPPPLPKSASLPLHAKRIPPQSPEQHKQPRILPASPIPVPCSSSSSSAPSSSVVSPPSQQHHPPTALDQSPVIIDLLEQLESTRNATSDLKAQLAQARASSASTASNLEAEIARARTTKKNEDAARVTLKTRTKSLDDARRHADGAKREAEKKLKAAESRRDHANDLIERLGTAVENMKQEMEEEVVRVEKQRVSDFEKRETLSAEIDGQREELRNVNAHVQVLAAQARVLESAIAEEKEKYEKLKEVKDKQAKEREEREKEREKEKELEDGSASSSSPMSSVWPPRLSSEHSPGIIGPLQSVFSGHPILRPSQQLGQQVQPHAHPSGNLHVNPPQFRPFGPEIVSSVSAPLRDSPLSPISTSLIPSSLMQSIDTPSPHSQTVGEQEIASSPIDSPTSSGGGGISTIYEEPFVLVEHKEEPHSAPPVPSHIRFDDASIISPSVVSGNAASKLLHRPKSPSPSPMALPQQNSATQSRGRWFGNREKGLNPDAKVFTLSNQGNTFTPAVSYQDNVNNNPMMKPMVPDTGLAMRFGRAGSGHAHTSSRSKARTITSEFGPIGSTVTAPSPPNFFHHPKSSVSAPSLQDGLFIHGNATGHLSLREASSPPPRPAGAVHTVPPPPLVPSIPFNDNMFFKTLQNAFAPLPEEREALLRHLGGGTGSANTSREKLSAMIIPSGSGAVSTSGPLSSSGSGSSGSASASSMGTGATSGSPGIAHRNSNSISNPSPRGNGPMFAGHGISNANANIHPSHTHSASSISHSQTHRNVFDPWAGEDKSDY